MVRDFDSIPKAIPDSELRGQVFAYFEDQLRKDVKDGKEPTQAERKQAAIKTFIKFPMLVDYYIRHKENNGDKAIDISADRVREIQTIFEDQLRELRRELAKLTNFYNLAGSTYEETHLRIAYLKDVIETKGGIDFSGTMANQFIERVICTYLQDSCGLALLQTSARKLMMGVDQLTLRFRGAPSIRPLSK